VTPLSAPAADFKLMHYPSAGALVRVATFG
jgi:hypothetical protein